MAKNQATKTKRDSYQIRFVTPVRDINNCYKRGEETQVYIWHYVYGGVGINLFAWPKNNNDYKYYPSMEDLQKDFKI